MPPSAMAPQAIPVMFMQGADGSTAPAMAGPNGQPTMLAPGTMQGPQGQVMVIMGVNGPCLNGVAGCSGMKGCGKGAPDQMGKGGPGMKGFGPGPEMNGCGPRMKGMKGMNGMNGMNGPSMPGFNEKNMNGFDGCQGGLNGQPLNGEAFFGQKPFHGRDAFHGRPSSPHSRSFNRGRSSERQIFGKSGKGKDGKDGKGFGKRKGFDMFDSRPGNFATSQKSGQWQQRMPDGSCAMVSFIADQSNLQQAANRLNCLGHGAIIVMDCHGCNLKAAAGKLCLLTIAFSDVNLQVFIFDVLQLGEELYSLTTFFTNPNASKVTADASTHATVLAQKFGINLSGVIDAQWAYETIEKKPMVRPLEVLEWCGLAPPEFRQETLRLEGHPEIWADRPLPQPLLSYAAQGIALLHSASSVMWKRLAHVFGQAVLEKVLAGP